MPFSRPLSLQWVEARVHYGLVSAAAPASLLAGRELAKLCPFPLRVTSLNNAVAHVHFGSRLLWVTESQSDRDRAVLIFETTGAILDRVRGHKYGRLCIAPEAFEAAHQRLLAGVRHFLRVLYEVNQTLSHREPRCSGSAWRPAHQRRGHRRS